MLSREIKRWKTYIEMSSFIYGKIGDGKIEGNKFDTPVGVGKIGGGEVMPPLLPLLFGMPARGSMKLKSANT